MARPLEAAPETGGWSYTAVQPDGRMMNFPQSFCHDCHMNFDGQDGMASLRPSCASSGSSRAFRAAPREPTQAPDPFFDTSIRRLRSRAAC